MEIVITYITKKGDEFPQLVYLGTCLILIVFTTIILTIPKKDHIIRNLIIEIWFLVIYYQNFWSKLEPYLEGVSTVYFSPEGVYSKINPNVLYDSTSSSFLIDKYDIVYVSNVEDFVHQKENIQPYEQPDNLHAVLIGNPTFLIEEDVVVLVSNENRSRSINQDELDSLQRGMLLSDFGTQTEIDLISNNLKSKGWDVETISGVDHEQRQDLRVLEFPKILHIA